jgi:hypothetical protein
VERSVPHAWILRNVRSDPGIGVQEYRHNEYPVASHHVGALIGKIPLKAKIAFVSRRRVGRDEGSEERAVADLAPDLLIPNVPPRSSVCATSVEPDAVDYGA